MKKIVDCFPFFNEEELLELRVHLLNEHVDEFIISELNYTHSGNKKDFLCKELILKLGLPEEKIKVIEVTISEDNLISIDSDYVYASSSKSQNVKNWSRERVQRDSLLEHIEEYDDETVFILSDCDEIIDPKVLSYFSQCCRNSPNNIIKVPLISLEGGADKRVFTEEGPLPWNQSLVLCTKKQLKSGGSPTKFRGGYENPYPPVWITQDNQIIQDCGWHFTWMGSEKRRKIKSESTIHADNLDVYDNLSSSSMSEIGAKKNNLILKNYPIQLLPQIIFELPRVKEFLLPSTSKKKDIRSQLSSLYTNFDNNFGEWGWCSVKKSNKIIDCVLEFCNEQEDPTCVEIGVYGGKSFFPFALALKDLNRGKVYGIDPWTNQDAMVGYEHPSHKEFWGNIDLERIYNIFLQGIEELNVEKYCSVLRKTSDDAEEIKNISVLHIDGQHTDQLLRDINKYAKNVLLNGYCFVDDVEWCEDTKKSVNLMESLGFEKIDDIDGCFVYKRKSNIFFASIKSNQKPTSIIVDNFYDNPDEVRKFAMEQEYIEGGIGRGFIGRRTQNQFLFPGLKERFEMIIGRKITAWEEHGMNGKFQMAWAGEPLVWHCDSQTYGGMIYLTPDAPYQCGTTLYAHKKTRARTYYDEGWDVEWGKEGGTTHLDGTPWEPVDVLGNVYNRLAIFDGSAIHSASQYFGNAKENARLWQMFFFDTE